MIDAMTRALFRQARHHAALMALGTLPLLAMATSEAPSLEIAAGELLRPWEPAIDALFKQVGVEARYSYWPLERALQRLLDGDVDGDVFRHYDVLLPVIDRVRLVGPLSCSEFVALSRGETARRLRSFDDLKPLRVGIRHGAHWLRERLRRDGVRLEVAPDGAALFEMLERGRFDVALDTRSVLESELRARGAPSHLTQSRILHFEPSYLVLRRQLDPWAERLQAAYDQQLRSGQWLQRVGEINAALGLPRNLGMICLPAAGR